MRYIASIILACCIASPAFAGQEFCQIANSGSCGSHVETQIAAQPATVSNSNTRLTNGEAIRYNDGRTPINHSGYALLDLDLMDMETPSTPR